MLFALIKCIEPNTNPEIIINNILDLKIFLKFNLNINSYVNGAIIIAEMIAYIGYLKRSASTYF